MTAFKVCLECQGQTEAGADVCRHCGAKISTAPRPRTLRRLVLLIGLVALLIEFVALMARGPH